MKIHHFFKKIIIAFFLCVFIPFLTFAACDYDADPFCGEDIDAPIDNGVWLLIIVSCMLVFYMLRNKKNKVVSL
ncbi:MAG: hypothetical protein EAY66_02140 [Sphingobacteriales bacterium]|jgi:hypothetical protein|nr:MAG: hypothetical protein EAY66_02140 [Sphingobacteriales bacterium]